MVSLSILHFRRETAFQAEFPFYLQLSWTSVVHGIASGRNYREGRAWITDQFFRFRMVRYCHLTCSATKALLVANRVVTSTCGTFSQIIVGEIKIYPRLLSSQSILASNGQDVFFSWNIPHMYQLPTGVPSNTPNASI